MDNFEYVLSPVPSNIFIQVKTGMRNMNSLEGEAVHPRADRRAGMKAGNGLSSKKHGVAAGKGRGEEL